MSLLDRIRDHEDGFTERKPEGASRRELRKTIVAFANSVREGQTGVLFIGVRDSGELIGVGNPDKLQKTVREICEKDCYPPVRFQSEVLSEAGRDILAVVVPPSGDRPHFSGPAYVRRGSESVAASQELLDELVASRVDKCRRILRLRGSDITITARGGPLGSRSLKHDRGYLATHRGRVRDCDAHSVRLDDFETNTLVSAPLENVRIAFDERRHRPELIVDHP